MAARRAIAALVLCAGLLASSPSHSQAIEPGREGPLAELVPPIPNRSACFARRYDAAHLKAHPAQKVTAVAVRILYHRHEADGTFTAGQRNYYFTLTANLRGRKAALTSSGECGPRDGAIVCMVECDGGGFALSRGTHGSVLLDLTRFGRLRLSRGCDEDDARELEPGQDDKRFWLHPAGDASCPSESD